MVNGGSVVKNMPDHARDVGSIPGSGRFPGEGNGNPLQYSCLGNPWTEEPGGLQSMGSHSVRHSWSDGARTHIILNSHIIWFPVAQMVKDLPAMQETRIQSLGQEDTLEKGMATHPSILAWRIPETEGPGGLQSVALQKVRHDWATNPHTHHLI